MTANDAMTVGGAAVLVAILAQVLKGLISERIVPFLAIGLGILVVDGATAAAGLTAGTLTPLDLFNGLLTGIIAGASSIGLYQVQKPAGILSPKQTPETPADPAEDTR